MIRGLAAESTLFLLDPAPVGVAPPPVPRVPLHPSNRLHPLLVITAVTASPPHPLSHLAVYQSDKTLIHSAASSLPALRRSRPLAKPTQMAGRTDT